MSSTWMVGAVAIAIVAMFVALWGVSLARKDASIVDIFWGPSFAVVAWLGVAFGTAAGARPILVATLVTAWGLRLGLHLYRRNHGQPEDYRYAAMRAKHGARFGGVSLYSVFLLQAVLVLLISSPLQLIASSTGARELGPLDALGTFLIVVGIAFEAIADEQLVRFRRDPANRGRVLDTGLWRYSRHPNYFGDAVVWWGICVFGFAAGSWPSFLGPVLMTFLLLKVSGVSLLEKTIAERRPEYASYVSRTSTFIPWPPKRRT